jgi:hypothetical protein
MFFSSGVPPHPGPLPWGEGESSQFSGKATAECCSNAFGFYEMRQRLFLLPEEKVRMRGKEARFLVLTQESANCAKYPNQFIQALTKLVPPISRIPRLIDFWV